MDIYNNVIDCSGVYIKVIATKLAAQSIEFEVGGGKMPRILNTRIKLRTLQSCAFREFVLHQHNHFQLNSQHIHRTTQSICKKQGEKLALYQALHKAGYSVVKSQYLLPKPIGIAYQSQGNSSVFLGNPTQYQGGQYLGRNWQFSAELRPMSESFPIGRTKRSACSDWLEIYGLRSSIPCLFRYPLLQHYDYLTIHPCCRWLTVTVYTIYRSF
jgi:hypothetical protein